MGDGVLVYLGYPQAHEDYAEQAIRSGLGDDFSAVYSILRTLELKTSKGVSDPVRRGQR